MTPLVESALREADLWSVLTARRKGDTAALQKARSRLETADLLALGALADEVRKIEVGDAVCIFANVAPDDAPDVVNVTGGERSQLSGLSMLRATAIARVTGPLAARVRVDWSLIGLELAQVALGFGASELVGPIASKRGLPIAGDAEKKVKGQGNVSVQLLKKRELAALVARSGRRPTFAAIGGGVEASDIDTDADLPAHRADDEGAHVH
jgi:2-iminoacetate synthase ThiH